MNASKAPNKKSASGFRKETRAAFLARQVREARARFAEKTRTLLASVSTQSDLNHAAAAIIARSDLKTAPDRILSLQLCRHSEQLGLLPAPAFVAFVEKQDIDNLPARTFTDRRASAFGSHYAS